MPVTNAWAALLVSMTVCPIGAPMNGRPAIRAERMSVILTERDFAGSTVVMMGSMVRLVCVVAYWRAVYQLLKNALISGYDK